MNSAYFDNQLLQTPLAENNNHTILLFDASQLQVDELTLTQFLSPFELSVIARRKTPQANPTLSDTTNQLIRIDK